MIFYLQIFIAVLFIVYIIQTPKYSRKINESPRLGKSQKKLNLYMIWIIPFLWYWMIKKLLDPTETMTKDKRKIDKSHFYESGAGKYPVS